MQKITLSSFKTYKKNAQKIVAITAYDALMAKIFDEYADMILVGDSLHMSFNASSDTLGISMDAMIYHTQAVCAGARRALIVADMPFGSYYNVNEALKNALRFYNAELSIPCAQNMGRDDARKVGDIILDVLDSYKRQKGL